MMKILKTLLRFPKPGFPSNVRTNSQATQKFLATVDAKLWGSAAVRYPLLNELTSEIEEKTLMSIDSGVSKDQAEAKTINEMLEVVPGVVAEHKKGIVQDFIVALIAFFVLTISALLLVDFMYSGRSNNIGYFTENIILFIFGGIFIAYASSFAFSTLKHGMPFPQGKSFEVRQPKIMRVILFLIMGFVMYVFVSWCVDKISTQKIDIRTDSFFVMSVAIEMYLLAWFATSIRCNPKGLVVEKMYRRFVSWQQIISVRPMAGLGLLGKDYVYICIYQCGHRVRKFPIFGTSMNSQRLIYEIRRHVKDERVAKNADSMVSL